MRCYICDVDIPDDKVRIHKDTKLALPCGRCTIIEYQAYIDLIDVDLIDENEIQKDTQFYVRDTDES